MLWGKKRWAALVAALLALAPEASAQTGTGRRASLGVPDSTAAATTSKTTPAPRSAPTMPAPVKAPIVDPRVKKTALQKPADDDDTQTYSRMIQLTPPGRDRLFRLESEEELFERMRIQRKLTRLPIELPRLEPMPPPTPRPQRDGEPLITLAEPSYLCYGRLYFEQRNAERYGWDLGVIHPPLSAAIFYADLLTWPLHWALDPFRCFDCNTGLCLPGDSTPLVLDWLRVK